MVKTHVPPEAGEMACPACGAGIRATPSPRRRRVQCPKCREVVVLESAPPKESQPSSPPAESAEAAETRRRVALLEARVEALEAALRESAAAAARNQASNPAERKLSWITSPLGQAPDFSAEQGRALFHNLAGVRTQAITIRTPAGNPGARTRAEWFKSIFERAGWTVQGPEEITPDATTPGLALSVPELPVPKDAAATYLALKAAGFEPIPVLDSISSASDSRQTTSALSLTLPPEKAA